MEGKFNLSEPHENSVAVIGMAGRFRGAEGCGGLWDILRAGREVVGRMSEEELDTALCPKDHRTHPHFVPVTAQLERVDSFDASFFGFTPAEAREMDPQFRLLLETSWHAFEDAGYAPGDELSGLTGVFGGVSPSFYLWLNAGADIHAYKSMAFNHTFMLNAHDFVTTWISYKLGLRGPSIALQTACSTGLVAVATACQNILDYSCDTALAVSASIFSPRGWGYWAESGGILSPDGHCRPFDSRANGTIMGEGVCALLLKRFQDALRDGDRIHGLIRGFAVNNDGPDKAGFTAPGARGQAAVIRAALEVAQVHPEDIGYLEAHGTGTHLGDSIEFESLDSVFGGQAPKRPLGSLKSNLGHLGSAAGMASLIKVLLMLRHKEIPPQINFREPNPNIPLEKSAFRIATQGEVWPGDKPRLAGISSLGFGGTNCHVVVEECPAWARPEGGLSPHNLAEELYEPASISSRPIPHCLLFSAPNLKALKRQAEALSVYFAKARLELASTAWTLSQRRKHFPFRAAIVASTPDEAAEKLRTLTLPLAESVERPLYFRFSRSHGNESKARALLDNLLRAWPELAPVTEPITGAAAGQEHPEKERVGYGSERCRLALLLLINRLAEQYGLKAQAYICAGKTGTLAAAAASGMLSAEEAIRLLEAPSSGLSDQWPDFRPGRIPLVTPAFEEISRSGAAQHFPLENVSSGLGASSSGWAGEGAFVFILSGPGERERAIPVFEHSAAEDVRREWNLALAALYCNGVLPRIPRKTAVLAELPFYVFEPQSHWLEFEPAMTEASSQDAANNSNSLEVILSIWREAFGILDATEEDDFFVLGGTSMTAIEIIASVQTMTGVQISMAEFMKIRTAKQLHAVLSERIKKQRESA